MGNVFKKLAAVQSEVKATKDAYNSFGKYHYRSCESILEAVKPILKKNNSSIIIRDDIQQVGDRYYIMATAKFADCETDDVIEVTAFAREEDTKKGMDGAQITGSASSYARKYALAGLLLLDDNKDADATNKHGKDDDAPFPDAENEIKVQPNDVQMIHNIMTVYPKENRDTSLKLMLAKYKADKVEDLSAADFVKFREELLQSADKMKNTRLLSMVKSFAEKGRMSEKNARDIIETGIGKLDDVTVGTFNVFASQFLQMYKDLEINDEQADD